MAKKMHCQGKESLVGFALTLHKTVAVLYSKNFERDKDLHYMTTVHPPTWSTSPGSRLPHPGSRWLTIPVR